MITPFDLVLILIIFAFVMFGLWFGLVHAVGGVVGTVIGAIVAMKYYTKFASTPVAELISFIVLFVLGSRLTAFIFYLIEKALKVTQIIPGVKTLNRLAGGALGLVEGSIIVGVVLIFASRLPLPALIGQVERSEMAQFLIGIGTTLLPLFPEALRQIREASDVLPEIPG